jgi:hypothetical protein
MTPRQFVRLPSSSRPFTVRAGVVALMLVSLCPGLVSGQTVKAGVVTTLEGNVVATRAAQRSPVALKFRDDVFVDDRITTGDRSLARLLLGGKAVVTVRERSSLTITEVPGRATVNLESGKIAVAVARERMRPGDTLEVRTPNAVAGVRGTVFIVEVSQATAQATGGASAVTTQVVTLQGSVGVQFAGPSGWTPATIVGADQFAAQTGATGTPRSGTLTPELRAAALAGLRSSLRASRAANADQVKDQLTQTTAAALNTLLGNSATAIPPVVTALSTGSDVVRITDTVNVCTTDPTVCQPQPTSPTSPATPATPATSATPATPATPTPTAVPSTLLINDLFGHLVAHDPLLPMANPNPYVVSFGTTAIAAVPGDLSDPIVVPSDSLFAVTRGSSPAITTLQRPLLVANSDLMVSSGNLLTVDDILVSLGPSPLLSVNSAALDVTPCRDCESGGLVVISGVDRLLGVAGPVLDARGARITTTGDVIAADSEAVLSSVTRQPLIRLTDSSVVSRTLFGLDSEATGFLTGPLLVSTANTGRNTVASTEDLITMTAGGTLVANLVSPDTAVVRSDHTDYDIGHGGIPQRHFFSVRGTTGALSVVPSSAMLTGTLLTSRDDSFDVTAAMLQVNSGTPGAIVEFTSTTTSPLMSFVGSRVTLGAPACGGGRPNCMAMAQGTGNLVEVNPFTSMTLHGPIATVTAPSEGWVMDALLSSFGSHGLTTSGHTGPLFAFDGATNTAHAVNGSMFDLGGVARTAVDSDPDAPATVLLGTDQPLRHAGTLYQGTGGASMTTRNVLKLDTALMEAMAPIVALAGAGTTLTSATDAMLLTQRAKLSAEIPADALVKVNTGATFTVTSGSLVTVASGSFARLNVGALVGLGGGGTLSLLDGALVKVSGNGSFSLTGALVSFTGANNTLSVSNAFQPTGFINGVPVFSVLGGTRGFNITRTNASLFPGLGSNNNRILINGTPLSANATSATGSVLAITGGGLSKIKIE